MKAEPFNPATKLVINPYTVTAGLDGGVVILGQAQQQYYALNQVGARIWRLIQDGLSLKEILNVLVEEYDAPAEALWQDIQNLTSDLLLEGLVSIADQ